MPSADTRPVLVSDALHARLKAAAKARGMTITDIVAQALLAYLPQLEAKGGRP